MLVQYRPLLDKIESRYGVDRYTLVAIWGMESYYGEVLSDPKWVKGVIRSLATLAYGDRSHARFARQQLVAALRILQRGDISLAGMTGSWAGAMGHTQFIPTTYEAFAVDFDGDGRRDIWNFARRRARLRRQLSEEVRLGRGRPPGATRSRSRRASTIGSPRAGSRGR